MSWQLGPLAVSQVGDEGLERAANSSGKTGDSQASGAISGASGARNDPIDARLARLVEAWHKLPERDRERIGRIVDEAMGR